MRDFGRAAELPQFIAHLGDPIERVEVDSQRGMSALANDAFVAQLALEFRDRDDVSIAHTAREEGNVVDDPESAACGLRPQSFERERRVAVLIRPKPNDHFPV